MQIDLCLPSSFLQHTPGTVGDLLIHAALLGRVDFALTELLLGGVKTWIQTVSLVEDRGVGMEEGGKVKSRWDNELTFIHVVLIASVDVALSCVVHLDGLNVGWYS